MSKLIAILHDGNFAGDSSFYVSTNIDDNVLEYDNETFEQLRKKYVESYLNEIPEEERPDINDEDALIEFFENEGARLPTGAWIIDEKGIELIDIVTDVDCGSDSATYTVNHIAKRVAARVATKCLGEVVDEDSDDES